MSGRVVHAAAHTATRAPARRVRHEVRDGLAVMAFSLGTSVVVAVVLMLLVGTQG